MCPFLNFFFQVVPTTDHIDTEKLKAREQIKFFEEVLLFEDAFLLPSHTKGRLTRYKIPDSQPFLSELL